MFSAQCCVFRRGAAWDQLFVKWRNICSWSTISTCVTDGQTVVTRGTVCYVWDGLYRAALALLLLTSLIKWGNCMLQFCGIRKKTWLHFMHEYDLVREFDWWGLFVSAIQWAQLGGWVTIKLFPDNPLLCPVLAIIVYLSRTSPLAVTTVNSSFPLSSLTSPSKTHFGSLGEANSVGCWSGHFYVHFSCCEGSLGGCFYEGPNNLQCCS